MGLTYTKLAYISRKGMTMDEQRVFSICIGVIVLGFISIIWLFLFGQRVFSRHQIEFFMRLPSWESLMEFWQKNNIRPNIPRYVYDSLKEVLQRRNEFWTTYGQFLLAILMIIVLSLLLFTKTITAEAGLPILSALIGFTIAKGPSGTQTGNGPDSGPQG